MSDEYPTAAFVLLLIGGILELVVWLPLSFMLGSAWITSVSMGGEEAGSVVSSGIAIVALCIVLFIIWSILMIVAAVWVKTGDPERVHKGGVLGLIASILGGLNIFALIGAILALSWSKKPRTIVAPPPPPV